MIRLKKPLRYVLAWLAACGCCQAQVECPQNGWAGSSSNAATVIIPADRVNDGYCDCPSTGVDEPDTSACSGSSLWSGVTPYGDDDGGEVPTPMVFSCPQQPSLKLPLSRLNDGVCDCCDGADEPETGICKDECDAILAEERRLRKELEEKYRIGSEIRQQSIQDFEALRTQKLAEAEALEAKMETVEESLQKLVETYDTLESQWLKKRLDAAQSIVTNFGLTTTEPDSIRGMIAALSDEELTWWIIHACQMSGEMMPDTHSLSDIKTCIPLRLAALDLGIWWEPSTYEMTMVSDDTHTDLAKILDHNLKNFPSDIIWNVDRLANGSNSRKKNRRRLEDTGLGLDHLDDMEGYPDDDYGMADDDYIRYHDPDFDDYRDPDDEDYERHRRQRDKRQSRNNNRKNNRGGDDSETETKGDKREELLSLIKTKPFSFSRVKYLDQSAKLLSTIDVLSKRKEEEEEGDVPETPEDVERVEDDDEEEDLLDFDPETMSKEELKSRKESLQRRLEKMKQKEGSGEAAETPEEVVSVSKEDEDLLASIQFDPMALPMTKSELQRRQKSIERGLDYAISAKVLMDSFQTFTFDTPEQRTRAIQGLAMLVVGHGNLSAVHVWHLYLSVMPEMEGAFLSGEADEQTCGAPWVSLCPPKTVFRDVSGAECKLPPPPITEAADAYCKSLSAESSTESICASDTVVPSEVPNGYFGYFSLFPRSENDVLSDVFKVLDLADDSSEERKELLSLQEEMEQKQQRTEELKRSISDALDSVGGKEGDGTLGRNGELYNLKDECFSYEAAKYIYELCLFKKAKQKEGGSGGVHLGDWSGEEEDEDGTRIWKWQKGQKCWNGPQRSAEAVVTCGIETQVLSADEPETCRYVFEVESPVACDDAFRERHNL